MPKFWVKINAIVKQIPVFLICTLKTILMKVKINFIACLFIILGSSAFSQVKSISPGDEFTKIKVSTGLFVEIITNSDESKIDIKGSEREKVDVDIKNGELELSLPLGQLFSETEILVTVYTHKVEELKARSGSEVEFMNKVQQEELSLIASEGSYIGGEIEVKNLAVKSVTGASVSLVGFANNQNIELKTGGSYDGQNLETENTSISVSYGGEATVFSTDSCSASVTAGGDIDIYGSPSSISQNVKLGGNIQVIED
ncbi:hypothetical protein pgond44_12842 [Psychroflexus gondwanensis ACAM 44]|uniref:Putative auto-transporter adhesin head GIN domain-containing protein n=2 Tax=Psychroflexus gondwanensis TaxID=251 RepID=N1WSV8_9FLAO|nr:hypothetical protein pgond44_12842 [Psychroflexus gondwanensis ACAM 44]